MPIDPATNQERDDTAEFHRNFTQDKTGFYIQNEMPRPEPLTPERLTAAIRSLMEASVRGGATGKR